MVVTLEVLDGLLGTDQGHATARHHAFFHRRTGRVQGVFNARLLFLHFNFGSRTDLDHCHAAGQLGHAFLQFFAVVIGGGFLDLATDLLDPAFDILLATSAVDDGGVFLIDLDFLGVTHIVQGRLFEGEAEFLGNHLAAGQHSHVLQHGLAAIAEAGGFDSADLDDAADGVDHQGGQCFAFHVFGDDQERLAGLGHCFEHRQHFTDVGDLLVVEQDVGIVQLAGHALLVVDEIGRQIAPIKLHALDHVEFVFQARTVLDGDHAFLADLFHRLGDQVADNGVGVGRDGTDLGDSLLVVAGLGQLPDFFDGSSNGLVDAALEIHRIHAGGNGLHAFAHQALGQHGRGSGAVTGHIGGLGSDFLDHLHAHVLEAVLQFDFLGDGHTVLGHRGGTEALFQNDVAAFGAQRDLDRVGQYVDAPQHAGTGVFTEFQLFGSHWELTSRINNQPERTFQFRIARMSSSRITSRSWPSSLTSVPEYLANSTLSPTFTVSARTSPLSSGLPVPTETTSPLAGFSAAESGITIPPGEVRSSSRRLTTTRSCKGRMFI